MTRGFAGRASVVWLVLGVTAGSLAALAIVVLTLNVFGSSASASAAAPAPRFVEEAAAAGVDHVYDGDFTFFVAAAWRSSTATTTGARTSTSPAARPAALYRNESPVGGPLRFEQVADPATDLTASPAPTRSTSTGTA